MRLDLSVDAFAVEIDGVAELTNQTELETLRNEFNSLYACWPEPQPAQLWAAVTRVLGRDPRT